METFSEFLREQKKRTNDSYILARYLIRLESTFRLLKLDFEQDNPPYDLIKSIIDLGLNDAINATDIQMHFWKDKEETEEARKLICDYRRQLEKHLDKKE